MSYDRGATVVEDIADLEALVPEWWHLWRSLPGATPFTSPAWLVPWWTTFSPGRLRCAALQDGERLIGLAPFYLEQGPLGARLLPLGIGLSDQFDILAADAASGDRLVRALAGHAADWDTLEFEEVTDGSACLTVPAPAGCSDLVCAQSASPVLPVAGCDHDDLACIPAQKRRKVRMARNRVARRGGTISSVVSEDLAPFLDDLARLHGSRWQERGEAGVLAEDAVLRFHRAALPLLAEAGLARLYTLTLEGRVAAAYYGFLHAGRAYAYLGGFDPDFAFESPGTVLIGHAIAEAARDGAREFDFLRGQEAYKYEWGAADRWSRRRSLRRVVA